MQNTPNFIWKLKGVGNLCNNFSNLLIIPNVSAQLKCPCGGESIDHEGVLGMVKVGVADRKRRREREMGVALMWVNHQMWSVGKRRSVCLKRRRWRESGAERKRQNVHCRHQCRNNLHPC